MINFDIQISAEQGAKTGQERSDVVTRLLSEIDYINDGVQRRGDVK